MNGQGSNRILPIKSLLQNLKQESKRQYLQLDNKTGPPSMHQNNPASGSLTHREHPATDLHQTITARDLKKGISVNKNSERSHHAPYSSKELPLNAEQGFNFYVPKKDRTRGERGNTFGNQAQEAFKLDLQTDHYGFGNKNNKTEQVIYHQVKHDIKVTNKNCDTTVRFTEEYDKESSMLTEKFNSKFEEETRSYSKFEKMESQPIFKDELTKIKTQLFHKEAMLFTKTQEIEEKDKMISELQMKLQMKEKKGVPVEFVEKIKNMEATIKAQANQIDFLRRELQQSKELYNKYEEDTATNYTLINLKLRQYEAEEREKSFQISEMKEKQKKKYQVQEKTIKALKEIVKERQEAFKLMRQQSISSESKAETAQVILKEKERQFARQLQVKETFIRQLSAEIGDLKNNLKNMEERIRQMIDEQSEMKEIISKFNEAKVLYQQKERLNEANISELKSKIGQLNQIVFKRESSLIAYKQKNLELEEKLKKLTQPSRGNSPPKASTSTSKLIKDNQRLSAIAKDFDRRLYQSMKLNQSLNEEVVRRELIILNASCISRLARSEE